MERSVNFNPERENNEPAWLVYSSQGKDYEVKDKDALELHRQKRDTKFGRGVKDSILQIPAPDPGNIVGYEYEVEESLSGCRMSGISSERIPCERATIRCNFRRVGFSRLVDLPSGSQAR